MDFITNRKNDFYLQFGKGIGYLSSFAVFLTVFYAVTMRLSWYNIPVAVYAGILLTFTTLAAITILIATSTKKGIRYGMKKSFTPGFKDGFTGFGHTVSGAVNTILLTMVYFMGVGLVSIVSKLSGKRFLDLSYKDKQSYYVTVEKGGGKAEDYLRQF